ncbi:hypothetical protein KI387_006599, partial [Taxus chinensis]
GCANIKSLKETHTHMFISGLRRNIFFAVKFVNMYAMLGHVDYARQVFDEMSERNVFLWNAMIKVYADKGNGKEALVLYHQMLQTGVQPDSFTFPPVLKVCTGLLSLQLGRGVHDHILITGVESVVFVSNSLITMYAKCDCLEFARKVFDGMVERDVISWNAMIVGYAQNGHANEALVLYKKMQSAGITPDSVTMASLLQAWARLGDLQQGKQIHDYVIRRRLDSNLRVQNSLVAMYAKCGSLSVAGSLFENMFERDAVSWNAMIAGYVQNGYAMEALILFKQMQFENVKPTFVTMASALQACAHLGDLEQGKQIHDCIIASEFSENVLVGTAVIDMYGKCGSIDFARSFFDQMPSKNVVSWNVMIAGYAQNGHSDEALALFYQMLLEGTKADSATMVNVLPACSLIGARLQGRALHGYIIKSGFEQDVFVGTVLVDMYVKCESLDIARPLFDKMIEKNVVSWNAMIAGYARIGNAGEALTLYNQMQLEDVMPDPATMVSVVQACAALRDLQQGKWIHNYVVENGFDSDVILETALIDMYAKCGRIEFAYQLFENMSERNVVAWNAMIAGYAHNGYANETLVFFNQMQLEKMKPTLATMVSVLPACAHLAALQHGKCIHGYIIRNAFELYVSVGNSLIDMYSKCGRMDLAHRVFDKMPKKDVVSWNAIISGYAMWGYGEHALAIFSQMQQITIVKPDHVTFLSILTACSHSGFVQEGWQYFDCMSRDHSLPPRMEHYASMVDLLGRAGCLDEAQKFIQAMPFEPGSSVWGAFLGACRIHCNIKLGEVAADHLFNIEPENTGYYILMSNIYAEAGRWDGVAK